MAQSYEALHDYTLHLHDDDSSTRLEVVSSSGESGTHFEATLSTDNIDTTGMKAWKAAYSRLPIPSDETDKQAFDLAAPDGKWGNKISLGVSERFRQLGDFRGVVHYLGFLYDESETFGESEWQKTLALHYAPLNVSNERAAELFDPNGMSFIATNSPVYGPEFFDSLVAGERLNSTQAVWETHDRATHEFGERTLGPEVTLLRQEIYKDVLSDNLRDPQPRELSRLLLRDDTLSDRVNKSALRANATQPMPELPALLHWYLNDAVLGQTAAAQAALSGDPRPGERYSPVIMDMAKSTTARLLAAVKRLEQLNA